MTQPAMTARDPHDIARFMHDIGMIASNVGILNAMTGRTSLPGSEWAWTHAQWSEYFGSVITEGQGPIPNAIWQHMCAVRRCLSELPPY